MIPRGNRVLSQGLVATVKAALVCFEIVVITAGAALSLDALKVWMPFLSLSILFVSSNERLVGQYHDAVQYKNNNVLLFF